MSTQAYAAQFVRNSRLVDPKTGIPDATYGWQFLLALFNRTGAGTGIIPKVSGPLAATGADIGSALGLTTDWNLIGTTPSGAGVQLPPMKPGNSCKVRNIGSNPLDVYPPSGLQINALGANAAYSLANGSEIEFECWTTTQIYTPS